LTVSKTPLFQVCDNLHQEISGRTQNQRSRGQQQAEANSYSTDVFRVRNATFERPPSGIFALRTLAFVMTGGETGSKEISGLHRPRGNTCGLGADGATALRKCFRGSARGTQGIWGGAGEVCLRARVRAYVSACVCCAQWTVQRPLVLHASHISHIWVGQGILVAVTWLADTASGRNRTFGSTSGTVRPLRD